MTEGQADMDTTMRLSQAHAEAVSALVMFRPAASTTVTATFGRMLPPIQQQGVSRGWSLTTQGLVPELPDPTPNTSSSVDPRP